MLRVGCGNSVRNHRPQWALSPASRFQVVRWPGAEMGVCGALVRLCRLGQFNKLPHRLRAEIAPGDDGDGF